MGSREQTHCKNGHPFDEANTHYRPNGRRQCRACFRERARAKYVPRPRPKRTAKPRTAKPRTASARPTSAAGRRHTPQASPSDADFLAQLQRETEASLRRDPSRWKWSTATGGRNLRNGDGAGPRRCEGCGATFTPKPRHPTQRYCTIACSNNAARRRARAAGARP